MAEMIDSIFVFAPEYDGYLSEKQNIDMESVVIVEEKGKEKMITQGKEYNFIPSDGKKDQMLISTGNGEMEWRDQPEIKNDSPWEMGSTETGVANAVLRGGGHSVRSLGSVAEGRANEIDENSEYSHAEGNVTKLFDSRWSHAEGNSNRIEKSEAAHIEGKGNNIVRSDYSHVEGCDNRSDDSWNSHVEGYSNRLINGNTCHAEGCGNSIGDVYYAHVEGYGNIVANSYGHAGGIFNAWSYNSGDFGDPLNSLFTVGNGTRSSNAYSVGSLANYGHNALDIRQNGDIYISDTDAEGKYYEKPMIRLQEEIKKIASKQNQIIAGDGLSFDGDTLNCEIQTQALTDTEIEDIFNAVKAKTQE